jgi:hypothetical protein
MSRTPITFDETGFERQGERDGVVVWFTPNGDGLGLFHYAIPPDIGADLKSVDSVRAFYRESIRESGLGVIEIETVVVDGITAVRTLFKIAQEPAGRTYLGALTLPFQQFSYVLKVQCEEHGITGLRDTLVLTSLMHSGETDIDASTGVPAGWLDDPYDLHEAGPMTRNKSERPEYDSQFPDHPLSRARRVLDHLERTVIVDDEIKRQPGFAWHP